jgi:hypothetical protein
MVDVSAILFMSQVMYLRHHRLREPVRHLGELYMRGLLGVSGEEGPWASARVNHGATGSLDATIQRLQTKYVVCISAIAYSMFLRSLGGIYHGRQEIDDVRNTATLLRVTNVNSIRKGISFGRFRTLIIQSLRLATKRDL